MRKYIHICMIGRSDNICHGATKKKKKTLSVISNLTRDLSQDLKLGSLVLSPLCYSDL